MKTKLELATERTYEILKVLDECEFNVDEPYYATLPSNLYVDDGACRVVIIDTKHRDFVLKYGWKDSDKKYCEREACICIDAEKEGVGQYFAWTHYICEYQGRSIYAMEYLDCNDEDIDDKSSDYNWDLFCEDNSFDKEKDREDWEVRDEFWDSYNDSTDHTYGVIRYMFSMISAADAMKLDHIIWNWDINDMHAGNFGYRNGQLVMCDYAGYGW